MKSIAAYHPEVYVRKRDGRVVAIKADMPDWSPDDEVLRAMAGPVGARTAGELVEALENGGSERVSASSTNDIIGCSVEPLGAAGDDEVKGWNRDVKSWDDSIV